jgi:hypothetical protein
MEWKFLCSFIFTCWLVDHVRTLCRITHHTQTVGKHLNLLLYMKKQVISMERIAGNVSIVPFFEVLEKD